MEQKWIYMHTGIQVLVLSNQTMICWWDLSMNQLSTTPKTGAIEPCLNTLSVSLVVETWGTNYFHKLVILLLGPQRASRMLWITYILSSKTRLKLLRNIKLKLIQLLKET